MQQQQFNHLGGKYAQFVEQDPFRLFLHYPAVLNTLSHARSSRVLDVGCGDGFFDQMLADELAMHVTGYDVSSNQIAKADERERLTGRGNQFFVSTPENFSTTNPFDHAVSVLVLPYADDQAHLERFLQSTSNALNPAGLFVSIVTNPDFDAFDRLIGCRRFEKLHNGDIKVSFLDATTGNVSFSSTLRQFSRDTYTSTAERCGFLVEKFISIFPSNEGEQSLGVEFWTTCKEAQPYNLLLLKKV